MTNELDPRLRGPYETSVLRAKQERSRRQVPLYAALAGIAIELVAFGERDWPTAVIGGIAIGIGGIRAYHYTHTAQQYDKQASDIAAVAAYEQEFPKPG